MSNWNVRVVDDDTVSSTFSILFKKAFPRRSISFFNAILSNLSEHRGSLVVLETKDKKPVGGVIIYKVEGYDFDCWSPSYFFVLDEYRNLSIPFLIKAQSCFSGNVINVTPSDAMCSILEAMRYKRLTLGSEIFFNFSINFFLLRRTYIKKFSTKEVDLSRNNIDIKFLNRKDLEWMSIIYKNKKALLCFKKTSWFGIPLHILVYCRGIHKKNIRYVLDGINKSYFGLSFIVYPKVNKSYFKYNLIAKKFRVYGNFENKNKLYTILGSEVTEIL
mgnify:CR=1 FL=1